MTERTTFEQAKICPKCGRMGKEAGSKPVRSERGSIDTLHYIECVTELCPWYQTKYFVQVASDGSIREPYQNLGAKKYPRLSQESVSKVEDAMRAQLEQETHRDQHGEVRNPRS